jgi:hypothetical protein
VTPGRRARLAAAVAVLLFVGVSLVYTQAIARQSPKRLAWRDLTAELGPVRWPRLTISVIRNRTKLEKILSIVTPAGQPVPKPPPIDYRRRIAVVFSTGPRSSTGYDLRVARIVDEGDRVSFHFREITPSLGDGVRPKLTYPYRLITIASTRKHLRFVIDGRP